MTSPVALAHPAALLLLPLVLLAVLLGRRRSGLRWRVATILRAATLALLVVALSGPLLRVPVTGVPAESSSARSVAL